MLAISSYQYLGQQRIGQPGFEGCEERTLTWQLLLFVPSFVPLRSKYYYRTADYFLEFLLDLRNYFTFVEDEAHPQAVCAPQ